MTTSVITLQSVCNYGTQLQAYATQKKLEQYFGYIEFVNYARPDTYGRGLRQAYAKGNPLRWLIFLPTNFKWKRVFGNFQKNNLNITHQSYRKTQDFLDYPIQADVYFSGSDQVWNTGWNNGIIPQLYLSYAPDDKPKYAFSSSFGQSSLTPQDIPEVKKYLQRYKRISVREETGEKIIREQIGLQNVIRLNDPTLSFDGDFWREIKTKNKIHHPYILIYNLNNNPDFDQYALEITKRTSYKLYRFCTRYDQVRKCGKSLIIPKIEDFITYIDDAKIVITDSFHAAAFSANLNTKVIILPPKKYSSRIRDFQKLIHDEGSIAKSYHDYSPLKHSADYKHINDILHQERTKIDIFLEQIKKEIK
jgi:hypothetical protein